MPAELPLPAVLIGDTPWPGDSDLAVQRHRFEAVVDEAARRLAQRLTPNQYIQTSRPGNGLYASPVTHVFQVVIVAWKVRRGLRSRIITQPVLGYQVGFDDYYPSLLIDPRRVEHFDGKAYQPGPFVSAEGGPSTWKICTRKHREIFLERSTDLVAVADEQGASLRVLVDAGLPATNA